MNIGDLAYWELRYAKECGEELSFELFDWYCSFEIIYQELLRTLYDTSKSQKILIIGIGRSNIIESLYSRGYRDITAIDISPTVIMQMQRKYSTYAGVEFLVMDTRSLLKFADESFTLIFDKACLDALFCGTDYFDSTTSAMKELYRVLKFEGVLMTLTHAPPVARVPYYRVVPWAIDSYKISPQIGEGLTLFVLTKTSDPRMLEKRVVGAEAAIRPKTKRVISSNVGGSMNRGSTTRSGQNSGSITVSASADLIAELVNESREVDG